MSEFVALDKNVEVLGAAILAVTASLGEKATPILQQHKLYPVVVDAWYNQQDWLDAFKDINEENFMNLVAIGMKIPDAAAWPPNVKTVHDALASINVAYNMNHRGGEIGGYHYEKTGENSAIIVCDNPYPSDFDYGLIYRTVQKFRQESSKRLVVKRDETKPTRGKGGNSCTYLIEW